MIYQSCLPAMGTRLQLVLPDVDAAFGQYLQTRIAMRIESMEQALSLYRSDSALCQLNALLAVTKSASIENDDLLLALTLAEAGLKLTQGFYNAACGELIEAVKLGMPETGFEVSEFSVAEQLIQTGRRGVQFDFGGLGKGMALDEVRTILAAEGVKNALLSFGESSILGMGKHPHAEHWPIAVPDPMGGAQPLVEVALFNAGLTLSSTVANGANQGSIQLHIVNPKTAQVIAEAVTSVVHSESLAWGEMLSTASLISGVEFIPAQLPAEVGLFKTLLFRH